MCQTDGLLPLLPRLWRVRGFRLQAFFCCQRHQGKFNAGGKASRIGHISCRLEFIGIQVRELGAFRKPVDKPAIACRLVSRVPEILAQINDMAYISSIFLLKERTGTAMSQAQEQRVNFFFGSSPSNSRSVSPSRSQWTELKGFPSPDWLITEIRLVKGWCNNRRMSSPLCIRRLRLWQR